MSAEPADGPEVSEARRRRHRTVIKVRLSEPTLLTDLGCLLEGMLDAEVRETHNELQVEFRKPGLEPPAQVRRIEQVARAWQANGHLDIRAHVALA